ncbi:hypothetical protein [Telluribacter sp. SYSU D00476]|uniref:hypothetical protein n=1 Tax=Telluribacter sp. SYSU D00476 TaxID=2811430 RepID=UPI001FF13A99|nr:hypothetical protein [Telluribacter sp. SYSU D00476]
MKKLVYLLGVIIAVLAGCKRIDPSPTVSFVIDNTSSGSIKEAVLSIEGNGETYDLTHVATILPGSRKSMVTSLRNSREIREGQYKVSVVVDNGATYQKGFGYFTNGIDPTRDKTYTITVTDTAIDVKSGLQ